MTDLAFTTPIDDAILRGAFWLEHRPTGLLPHRLPATALAQNSDPQLAMAQSQPSGVRLDFTTEARTIALETLPTKRRYLGMPPRPDGVYDLCIDDVLVQQRRALGGMVLEIDMAQGSVTPIPGSPQILRFDNLPSRAKRVTLWLPHDETTELVALRSDAPLLPIVSGREKRWVHHGSSISQGSNATSPTGIWPVIAARNLGLDLTNLGFGGSALLDPFTARAMRDRPADLLSIKIGINLFNLDLMRMRAFGPAVEGFLDTLREGHPDIPLLVISPIFCPIHETTPGPGRFDPEALRQGRLGFVASGDPAEMAAGKLTLVSIRERLAAIVARRARHDPHIAYLDGRDLYGEADNAILPLPDGLHPDAEIHALIGQRFTERLGRILAD
ncbi:GDSL-type esterase/lipase family protein [Devosia chinhatensis]|uniref:Lipase n=1 Tax=Devosia chinhatensis TaxID=429727 RepID=A0A0F5FGY2_9HYPH|nr:GDSL-type esterase/lipase family protein [Devosia chinhatensis]KKB08033.1 lipase [Devosia chinhatensis]